MQEYNIEFQGLNIQAKPPEVDRGERRIILGIAGGPGLSNEYFKNFIYRLGDDSYTLAIVDLPGHGHSKDVARDYRELIETLAPLINFLTSRFGKVFLVGHSFGARICFDLVQCHGITRDAIFRTILISLPLVGVPSKIYTRRVPKLTAKTEDEFVIWWKFALQHLVRKSISEVDNEKLTSSTSWMANSKLLCNLPDIYQDQLSAFDLQNMFVINGKYDFRLGTENSDLIQRYFDANRRFILDCGHFPTLEDPAGSQLIVNRIISMETK